MLANKRKLNLECLRYMLRSIIGFCLKRSINIQELLECAKSVYITEASKDILSRGEKPNISRLSVMTGMHRRDVMRILDGEDLLDRDTSIPSRVIGQWEQDKRFTTKTGQPRVITCDGDNSEFSRLVRAVSKDVHAGSVLFELLRTETVQREKNGIKLNKRVDSVRGDPEKGFRLLGNDVSDLIGAAEENIVSPDEIVNLHGRTEYDNIFEDKIPEIRKWLLKEGSAFHRRARAFLAKFDKDINTHVKKPAGAKVVLGTFSRVISQEDV